MARIVASAYAKKKHKKRPGIHAKCKTSKMKNSKHYKKLYKGQGR
jgi:hypothetical protein